MCFSVQDCDYPGSETSAHEDITISNNATWSSAFQYGDPTDTSWTLNGATFAADVKVNYYDATAKLSVSTGAGTIVIDDPVQRVIHFNVPPATLQNLLTPGYYVYDLLMTDALGVVTQLMHGALQVGKGVTAT
jgi:hypothetical protein